MARRNVFCACDIPNKTGQSCIVRIAVGIQCKVLPAGGGEGSTEQPLSKRSGSKADKLADKLAEKLKAKSKEGAGQGREGSKSLRLCLDLLVFSFSPAVVAGDKSP